MALGACLWFSPQLTFKSDHVQCAAHIGEAEVQAWEHPLGSYP